jgi:hypothetical protein
MIIPAKKNRYGKAYALVKAMESKIKHNIPANFVWRDTVRTL